MRDYFRMKIFDASAIAVIRHIIIRQFNLLNVITQIEMDAPIRHSIFIKLIIGNFCVVWDVIVESA